MFPKQEPAFVAGVVVIAIALVVVALVLLGMQS